MGAQDAETAQLGPSNDGTVMLDIGGDVGALVLHTGADLLLAEIEISRVDGGRPLVEGRPLPHQHHLGHAHTHDDGVEHTHAPDEAAHVHGDHAPRTHVAVRERRGPNGVRYAAIYDGLPAGEYQVWHADGSPADVVTIDGGAVSELDWR